MFIYFNLYIFFNFFSFNSSAFFLFSANCNLQAAQPSRLSVNALFVRRMSNCSVLWQREIFYFVLYLLYGVGVPNVSFQKIGGQWIELFTVSPYICVCIFAGGSSVELQQSLITLIRLLCAVLCCAKFLQTIFRFIVFFAPSFSWFLHSVLCDACRIIIDVAMRR